MIRLAIVAALCGLLAACQTAGPAPRYYAAPAYDLDELEDTLGGLAYSIPAQSYAVQAEHWRNIDAANQRAAANALQGVGPKTCSALPGTAGAWSCL